MSKLFYFPFYPGDWMKDPDLMVCSHFARGLLVDLLCAMFEAKRRGVLASADGVTPWTNEQIVGLSPGGSMADKLAALEELEVNLVLKRDCNGCLYSSRLVRDEEIRQKRAKAGSKGGSKSQANRKANVKQVSEQTFNSNSNYDYDYQSGTEGGSGETSDAPQQLKTWTIPAVAAKNPDIVAAIDRWQAYIANKEGRPWDDIRLEQALANKLSEGWTAKRLIQSIAKSIEWGAKTWRDPEHDFDKKAKPTNAPKEVVYPDLTAPTREPTR